MSLLLLYADSIKAIKFKTKNNLECLLDLNNKFMLFGLYQFSKLNNLKYQKSLGI